MRLSKKNYKIIINLVRILMAVIILFPMFYAISVSFMDLNEIFAKPPKIFPSSLRFDSYIKVFQIAPMFRFVLNSLIVSIGIVIGQIIVSSLAAFAFAFFDFKGKNILFMLLLATMMIPTESIVISNYMTIGDLNLFDTHFALILPSIASALSLFFLRQSFLQIPIQLHEAAKVDGCSNFRFFIKFLLPLSKGPISAISIFIFLGAWNQYLWPLLVTNKEEMRTVQIGISLLKATETQTQYNLLMAGVVTVMLPSIIIFFIGQRHILSGVFAGSVKA